MDLEVGQEASGFRILEVLGQGGMGVVYKASDVALARDVALKVIKPELARDEQFLKRFQTEARVLAKVNSPHIVGVHALRKTDSGLFIVMEYVEGGDLSQLLTGEALPVPRALDIAKQLLKAIERAHRAGVVHRDIKPQNIMISGEGEVKVTDFGLAKLRQPGMMTTMTQGVIGTLYYMSPEQIRGEELDARADLWAVGVVLYEMLAGERPFKADHEAGVMYALLYGELNIPDELADRLPEGLQRIVEKALNKDLEERYQSAAAMLDELEALDRPAVPTPAPAAPKPEASGRRPWSRVAIAAIVVAALGSAAYLLRPTAAPSDGPPQSFFSLATTPAGAAVTANGTLIGLTPIENHPVAADLESLTVEVSRDGFASVDTILAPGLSHTLTLAVLDVTEDHEPPAEAPPTVSQTPAAATTEPNADEGSTNAAPTTGSVAVSVIPGDNATIRVDDGLPAPPGTLTLPAGLHVLRIKVGDHAEVRHSITVTAGTEESFTCHVEGRIGIQSGATWGTIYINDERTELTTPSELSLGPGEYAISLRRFGYTATRVSGPDGAIRIPATCDPKQLQTLVFEMTQS